MPNEDAKTELDELRKELAEARLEIAALRERERQLLTLGECAPDYILRFDRQGTISYMNRPAPGHTMTDMLGSNVRRWMKPEHHAAFERTLEEVFGQGNPSSYESVGAVTGQWYIHRVSPVRVDGVVQEAILITHDITELKAAARRAQEADERYRALVEASFEGLALSMDNRIIEANQAFARMVGREVAEVIGLAPTDLTTPESGARVIEHIRTGSEAPYEVIGVRKDGTQFPCEVLGRNITYRGRAARITGFRDLEERRRQEAEQEQREERVRHAQKLETLGVLAGGIAHDFNNLLAAILGYVEMARMKSADAASSRECLDQISAAARGARDLTNQLLVYAGRGERRTELVDINALVRDSAELMRVSVSRRADLTFVPLDNLPAVEADIGQLRQVLINLITNASDALGTEPGSVTLCTGTQQLDAEYLRQCIADPRVTPGSYVFFEVKDTGCGMDEETQRRIFDPFFTTKFAGRGLGLPSVLGIVRAHRGAMLLTSSPGVSTRFRVWLPARPASDASPQASLAPEKNISEESALSKTRSGLILIADDEPMLAHTTSVLLQSVGYDVVVARDGIGALELFERHRANLAFVVLDVTMPRKDGLEVLSAIRNADTRVPVVLMSGYTESDWARVTSDGEPTEYLAKPFGLETLLETLDRLRGPAT